MIVVDLRFGRKSIFLLVVLASLSTCLTLYTVAAYNVARHVIEMDGTVYWRDSMGGSFFPWPTRPSGVSAPVLMRMIDDVDLAVYIYLIKSWVLVGIMALLWLGMFLYVLRLTNRLSIRQHNSFAKGCFIFFF